MQEKIFAVITGDIVKSSELSTDLREGLYNRMEMLSSKVLEFYADAIKHHPSNFRGDSWQVLVSKPEKALQVAMFLRTGIIGGSKGKRVDTRVSIGFGRIDYVPDDNVSGGDGEAYRLSGKALNRHVKSESIILEFPETMPADTTDALKMAIRLIDMLVTDWSISQARAVNGAMLGWTQQMIAENWADKLITQQAVQQHLEAAKWEYFKDSITMFESVIASIINKL